MRLFKLKKSLNLITAAIASVCTTLAFATPVNMYGQPKTDSKVVGSIDSTSAMVPIFTSKDGIWMKIGNPKNGDVGWIKVSDFNNKNSSGFSFTQETVDNGQGPKTTIQFGTPQPMTTEQVKEMEKRQMEAQKNIQKIVTDMYKTMYGIDPSAAYPSGVVPIFMPVIMVPPVNVQKPAPTPPAPPALPPSK